MLKTNHLYRARPKHGGDWIYGYILGGFKWFIAYETGPGSYDSIEVDRNSVCLCCGFSDIKGVLLFEDDVIMSGYGRTYKLIFAGGRFWCKGEFNFCWAFESIYRPEKIEDGNGN